MNRLALIWIVAALSLSACTEKTPAQRLDERGVKVGIMALQWPGVVTANSGFATTVVVRNIGAQTIPSLSARSDGSLRVHASYHWRSGDQKVVVWDGVLTPLDADLRVGAEQALNLSVRAPATPGKYILEIDLLQTGAFWFGGVGSQTASMVIEVKEHVALPQ